MTTGGYDEGYCACSCFWGTEPSTLVHLLRDRVGTLDKLNVLDAGCGEGKNAAFLAGEGAIVDAIDVSEPAVRNGRRQWPNLKGIRWQVADILTIDLPYQHYDIVVAYGLLHCMRSAAEIRSLLTRLQRATCLTGYFVLCAFNARYQDLSAHPGFNPCLLHHAEYMEAFAGWDIIAGSDSDLTERHPHNNIEHTHALTRVLARKRS
jgi:SAM-dependent methyltransferase